MSEEAPPPFGLFQTEVYLAGLGGTLPELPFAYEEWERRARELLSPEAYAYIAGGAGREATVRANREAFERRRIVPRMGRDIEHRDLRTELFGARLPAPVLLAPVGGQSMCHPEGDVATARAAASLGVPLILSTVASRSMEEVAEAMGDATRWFQLYWPRDPELAASLVSRAERAGYGAIVVTLDTSSKAWAPRDLAGAYVPMLRGDGLANYVSDPVFRAALAVAPEDEMGPAIGHFALNFMNPAVTWDLLPTLREHTSLPILVKGVLHPDDARRAVAAGLDGIVVSNHGGRQVDGAVASLDALPGVVDAVGDEVPVLLDSGVRAGVDVVRAVALGARAALIGRPFVWALAVAGEDGVRHVLRCLLAELDLTLALSGITGVDELGPDLFAPE